MSADDAVPTFRRATSQDAPAMEAVERAARSLLTEHGVGLDDLNLPAGFEEAARWTLALVAEHDGRIVGMARLTELTPGLLALDQVSVDPTYGGQGIGRELLRRAAETAGAQGYTDITGTTFRDVAFNGPFYKRLGCVEDVDPHPAMVERRRIEAELGLDQLGARVVMRRSVTLSSWHGRTHSSAADRAVAPRAGRRERGTGFAALVEPVRLPTPVEGNETSQVWSSAQAAPLPPVGAGRRGSRTPPSSPGPPG